MNNKKIKFLLLAIISLGILLIVGTYAYFTSDVNTNGNGLTTVLTTTVGDITLTKSVSEISSNKLIPGESISMNFNVNNPNKVDTYFSLYWNDVTNTFVNKNDLKVSIIKITDNEEESILSDAIFPSDEGPLLKGMLARAYTNEEYRLVVTYENTTSNQSDDMNKSIKGTIKPMLVDKLDVRITVEGTSRNIETGSDAKISDLGTPESSDPNKVFMGWSTSVNGDKVDENSSIDPNENYYAVYGTKISVSTSNEEVVSNIDTLSTRNTIDDLDKPTKVGYNFKGWSKTPNGTVLANNIYLEENTTYYAVYEPITYEVKYNQGIATSGTLPSTQNATYDVSFNLGNNTMTKDNLVVDSYKVTYNNGDSSSGTLPSAQISKNTTTYTADGWSTTSDGTKVYESNESVNNLTNEKNGTFNLYPYFTSSTTNGGVTLGTNNMSKSNTSNGTVTINLNANGGESTGDSDNKLYSNKYTTYTANGWTRTSGSRTRNYANGASTGALSADLTLYPCFSEGTAYDAVSLPTPSRSGYIFKGWSTDSSATSGITGTYTPTSDTEDTLYATWEAITYDDGTGASIPELATGMIPIYYDGTTMKVADTSSEWYNYSDHEWANAVLVNVSNSTIKNKYFNSDMTLKTTAVGQTVDMNEVEQMYVWIPRYRYQLWNVNNGSSDPQAINIVFEDKNESKSAGTTNGSWLTHPAFTFGSEELNGIWVGKFESSGSTSNITIKPNMASLASLDVATMFNASRGVESSSLLGLTANQVDTHMMKDTEWGAVAYLYSSIYGTYNADKSCISRGCEVWINNVSSNGEWNSTQYTGCAAQGVSTGVVTATACESGRGWDGAGVNASTTGNMYGIYDMSGGNWEYTMSVMLQSDGTPQIRSSGFSTMPDSKYYNTYPYGTSFTDHARGTIGTATKETLKTFGSNPGGWNGDHSGQGYYTVDWGISFGWSERGGDATDTTDAGVFAFSSTMGSYGVYLGFRVVLALTA